MTAELVFGHADRKMETRTDGQPDVEVKIVTYLDKDHLLMLAVKSTTLVVLTTFKIKVHTSVVM